MFDTLVNLLFFNLYATLITIIAVGGAIPYAAWQGLQKLRRWLWRSGDGDRGTGS